MPIQVAESKFSMGLQLSLSVFRAVLSLLWTREQQLEATLVCIYGHILWLSLIHENLASGTVKKVIEINPYLLGTMAGGAGEYLPSLRLCDV